MRISDWSSDVCSSDLHRSAEQLSAALMKLDDIKKLHQKKYRNEFGHFLVEGEHLVLELKKAGLHNPLLQRSELYVTRTYEHWQSRSEERRVGKYDCSTCRSRWVASH